MRWGVVRRPVFPARNARAMALQHPCNDDSETFSPLGSLGVLQCLSAASGVRFPSHRYVPPPVCRLGRPARLRTSSSPHRLPLKGGVIFRRDRVGKRGSYRFLFYEKMTVGVGLESRPFACHSRPRMYPAGAGMTGFSSPYEILNQPVTPAGFKHALECLNRGPGSTA